MTNHAAIRVDGLSKLYRVGARQQGYRTLRESVAEACSAPVRRLRNAFARRPSAEMAVAQGASRLSGENFWALKDVNFEVQPGEVVGIIGRNGAGKSTLLKILSRITEPTSGRIELRGRVGSLLEVGTGFHPELTGRENIYMNGSILGMSRREVSRKFDEIVAFSEVEDFLDTPVKRYSSGMYVRLAFAVAAHLDPEVLIVDEVLAVGDAAFQAKCLGRMQAIGRSGRTVLFVSHNMAAVESLCSSAVVMADGRVEFVGGVDAATRHYYASMNRRACRSAEGFRPGNGVSTVFRDVVLLDENGNPTEFVPVGGRFWLKVQLLPTDPILRPAFGLGIDNHLGQRILSLHSAEFERRLDPADGVVNLECVVPQLPLAPGDYFLKVCMDVNRRQFDWVENALQFTVTDGNLFGTGRGAHRGYCVAPSDWCLS